MLDLFRKVALVEGVTTLALFLVAMPLKYLAGWPALVPPAGWIHGVAFIVYVVVMVVAFLKHRVGASGWLRSFVAALFPFGTFINDPWVRRLQARAASTGWNGSSPIISSASLSARRSNSTGNAATRPPDARTGGPWRYLGKHRFEAALPIPAFKAAFAAPIRFAR